MADDNNMEEPNETTRFTQPDEVHVLVKSPTRDIMLFERSSGNILDPSFDSRILENYFQESSFPQTKMRFRFALLYLAITVVLWAFYFGILQKSNWECYVGGFGSVLLCAGITFAFTFIPSYQNHFMLMGSCVIIFVATLVLCTFALPSPVGSPIFTFGLTFQICLVAYTLIPVRLYVCIAVCVALSIIYEMFVAVHFDLLQPAILIAQVITHIVLHFVGIQLHLMSQVRRRTTFLKLCQSALMKKEVEHEKQAKTDMITSLMPYKVAMEVMAEGGGDNDDDDEEEEDFASHKKNSVSLNKGPEAQVTFRKFHVSQVTDVSILFADIVGFTKMSSNKTAHRLVLMLNDLFGRFDTICEQTGCEKIATLGDCYYAVSGCPEPKPDSAQCCVEMGLAMCIAIQEFDEEHSEEVNMRVGVHTGMVICGIVGTRRFKFDVWSNDVTLANEMESSGQPGRVHISQETLGFVKHLYEVEDGESVPDIRKYKVLVEYYDEEKKGYAIKHTLDESKIPTYFILRRLPGVHVPYITALRKQQEGAVEPKLDAYQTENETSKPDSSNVNGANAAPTDGALVSSHRDENNEAERSENSDSAMVSEMRASENDKKIFFKPPVNRLTLNFHKSKLEEAYRTSDPYIFPFTTFRRYGLVDGRGKDPPLTLASPRIAPLVDVVVMLLVLLLTGLSCFIGFSPRISTVLILIVAILLTCVVLLPLALDCYHRKKLHANNPFQKSFRIIFAWWPRNLLGALIIVLPSILVLTNFQPCYLTFAFGRSVFIDTVPLVIQSRTLLFGQLFLLSLVSFLIFTMYSSWTKSVMATLMCLVAILCVFCAENLCSDQIKAMNVAAGTNRSWNNGNSSSSSSSRACSKILWVCGLSEMKMEVLLTLLLTLLLIYFLNRDFDVAYRLSYNCYQTALVERQCFNREKKQAEWLLHNIIPSYIIEDVRRTQKYSRNLTDVAVVFATISNFADFYDEQFEGGKEMLRVLNEFFADIEELLTLEKYKDVEKIKTVASCFMAAGGLNMTTRSQNAHEDDHLIAMMDFCIDVLRKTKEFNEAIFSFNFELKIGFNIGNVVAGVIGTTKLLYDIWGDTVNVSSRMYSTGCKYRVQVTEAVVERLKHVFDFEYRGQTYCKGKGDLNTYLLVGRKKQ